MPVVGQKWTVKLLQASDLQKRWFEIHCPDGLTDNPASFLGKFSQRFPAEKVFEFGDFLVDLHSLEVFGDFNRGEIRSRIAKRSQGRFMCQGRKMFLFDGLGQECVQSLLSIIAKEMENEKVLSG